MRQTIFLRIASMLTILHSVMHTIGGVFGKPVPGIGAATEAVMRANHFRVLGVTRSYWELYHGMGLGISISLAAEGLVLWILGSLAERRDVELRPILWIFAVAYSLFAVNSYVYFFSGPVVVEALIVACLLIAIATAKPVLADPVPLPVQIGMSD